MGVPADSVANEPREDEQVCFSAAPLGSWVFRRGEPASRTCPGEGPPIRADRMSPRVLENVPVLVSRPPDLPGSGFPREARAIGW
jgi:hypothetical protein